MKLTSSFALSAGQALVRLLCALGLTKLLALAAGPGGLGVFGQFQAVLGVATLLATAPVTTGLVRQAAIHHGDEAARRALYGAATRISGVTGVLTAVVLVLAATPLSRLLLGEPGHASLLRWMALAQLCLVATSLLQSILNGEGALARLAWSQILGSLAGLAAVALCLHLFGFAGALWGLLLGPLGASACALALARRQWWFGRALLANVDAAALRRLAPYALSTLVTTLSVPVVDLLLRRRIAGAYGWGDAGYLQALTRISEAYLLVIGSVLSSHFLPRVAAASGAAAVRQAVRATAGLVLPVAGLLATALYLLREPLVRLAYSRDFSPILPWLGTQLAGDVLRVLAGIVGTLILARRSPLVYLATELGFSVAYLLLGLVLVDHLGWGGAVYAFIAAHALYLAVALPWLRGLRA